MSVVKLLTMVVTAARPEESALAWTFGSSFFQALQYTVAASRKPPGSVLFSSFPANGRSIFAVVYTAACALASAAPTAPPSARCRSSSEAR